MRYRDTNEGLGLASAERAVLRLAGRFSRRSGCIEDAGSGAAKGAAIGGGAGGAAVLATRGKEVELASGTAIEATTANPVTVEVR